MPDRVEQTKLTFIYHQVLTDLYEDFLKKFRNYRPGTLEDKNLREAFGEAIDPDEFRKNEYPGLVLDPRPIPTEKELLEAAFRETENPVIADAALSIAAELLASKKYLGLWSTYAFTPSAPKFEMYLYGKESELKFILHTGAKSITTIVARCALKDEALWVQAFRDPMRNIELYDYGDILRNVERLLRTRPEGSFAWILSGNADNHFGRKILPQHRNLVKSLRIYARCMDVLKKARDGAFILRDGRLPGTLLVARERDLRQYRGVYRDFAARWAYWASRKLQARTQKRKVASRNIDLLPFPRFADRRNIFRFFLFAKWSLKEELGLDPIHIYAMPCVYPLGLHEDRVRDDYGELRTTVEELVRQDIGCFENRIQSVGEEKKKPIRSCLRRLKKIQE